MDFKYHHINVVDLDVESEYLQKIQNEEFCIIGIEITIPEIAKYCYLNIDPQHDRIESVNMTSVESVFSSKELILNLCKIFKKVLFITIKTDLDSVAAICLLQMYLTNFKFDLDSNLILKFKAIAKSDRHGRVNYSSKIKSDDFFKHPNFNMYGIPLGLIGMVADYKLTLSKKVQLMMSYLNIGTFKNIENYTSYMHYVVRRKIPIDMVVLVPNKLVFVRSNTRGALSRGYMKCPVVIAKNESYKFGIGPNRITGSKITIAQYENSQFINLLKLAEELNMAEPGWGGSSCIIGSPQNRPTQLSDETIVQLTIKHLKK